MVKLAELSQLQASEVPAMQCQHYFSSVYNGSHGIAKTVSPWQTATNRLMQLAPKIDLIIKQDGRRQMSFVLSETTHVTEK